MASRGLRRPSRLTIHDSNGRDYLADRIGWSRGELETWLTSQSVRPHLQLWYNICVGSHKRFNNAVEWINTGENGYFYNSKDLEEDLLLFCLCEGDGENEERLRSSDRDEIASYSNDSAKTSHWITQELWARTAWRIVQSNRGQGEAFEKHIEKHPAACYGFVIDLLCLAFHSIAFRGRASIYEHLIDGVTKSHERDKHQKLDQRHALAQEADDEVSTTTIFTHGSSTAIDEISSDGDFSEGNEATTPASERSATASKTLSSYNTDNNKALQKWAEDVSCSIDIRLQPSLILHVSTCLMRKVYLSQDTGELRRA